MSISREARTATEIQEVVGMFETRALFDGAIAALRAAGVDHNDISVLASHSSLEVADPHPQRPRDEALTALVGELTFLFPLATAGLLAIVGGPITAPLAAVVAAGVGGLAIKDYLDEVTSHPDTEDFARSLENGGVVLWVGVRNEEEERKVATLMEQSGGQNVHLYRRED